jgi:hypothetical protein
MTRPHSTHGRNPSGGVRAPRRDRHTGEGHISTNQRSSSGQAKRNVDVISEGEDELTDKNQDELGEDEDEALERE